MTQNYVEAVEMGETYYAYTPETDPEALVAIGYRAGLRDAVKALNEAGAIQPSSEDSRRMYAILKDKFGSIARKFEGRAKELKV